MPSTGDAEGDHGSLGILLTTGFEHQDAHTVVRLARAAHAQGRRVRVFLMADGAYHIAREAFQALARDGIEVAVCAHNAEERAIPEVTGVPNLHWGSQFDLSLMTSECDRVIAFN